MTTFTIPIPATLMLPERPVIIYDADCGICQTTLAFVHKMDWMGAFESMTWWDAVDKYPHATVGDLDDGVRLALPDGSVKVAIEAVRSIAVRTPMGAMVAWMLWIPPIKWVADRIYRRVAVSRSHTCLIGSHPRSS